MIFQLGIIKRVLEGIGTVTVPTIGLGDTTTKIEIVYPYLPYDKLASLPAVVLPPAAVTITGSISGTRRSQVTQHIDLHVSAETAAGSYAMLALREAITRAFQRYTTLSGTVASSEAVDWDAAAPADEGGAVLVSTGVLVYSLVEDAVIGAEVL